MGKEFRLGRAVRKGQGLSPSSFPLSCKSGGRSVGLDGMNVRPKDISQVERIMGNICVLFTILQELQNTQMFHLTITQPGRSVLAKRL